MTKGSKSLNVQVPGEVAQPAAAAATTPATQSEKSPAPAAQAAIRETRDYRQMRAEEIDPKQLTAPVLSKDGWVCPTTK